MLIIIGSSVSVFILSSVICLLLLGCCCCLMNVRHKNKRTAERSSTPVTENPLASGSESGPIYEDLLPVPIKSKENELSIRENMAYSSIEIKWHSNLPA